MKKILVLAIAAVVCFCSCMTSEEDYIYTLELSRQSGSMSMHATDPEGIALVKEFVEAVNTFIDQNHSNWMWVETIYDGHSSKADAAAKKKYDKYNAEVQSLMNTYQAKFDALPDKGSKYVANYTFVLYRSLGGDEILNSAKYTISYGK